MQRLKFHLLVTLFNIKNSSGEKKLGKAILKGELRIQIIISDIYQVFIYSFWSVILQGIKLS